MKKLLLALIVLILAIAGIWFFAFRGKKNESSDPVARPLTVDKHNATFNESVGKMLDAYYAMTEGFVNWDSNTVNTKAKELKTALDSLKMDDLKKDTVIYQTALGSWGDAKAETEGLLKDVSLDEKRLSLNTLTQELFDLLRTVRYDQSKIYFQECPMAFNEDQPGDWLSKSKEVRNPYLGTKHPKYKDGMLSCGGPRDTLNFTGK